MKEFTKFMEHSFKEMRKVLLILLIGTGFIVNATAQGLDALSNPKIYVKLTHPPGLGLKINKVIFNPATGNCSDQIIDALISDFVSNEVEVIDRNNLQTILSEHDFNFSGYVDKNSAASIGKIIGPSAMITVKVLRCHTEIKDNLYVDEKKYNYQTKQNYIARAYIARTTVYLKASIQTTDLTTGRIFTARVVEYSPSRENKSYTGRPEVPTEFDVQELAFRYLTSDVHRMFFPWAESTDLYFMDDKKGGLKEAFQALKAGDIDQAFELSKKNLEFCKNSTDIKDKVLGHAYYNVGMMYFIQNDYDKAVEFFQESQKIRPGNIVTESISECNRAKALAEEMQKVDDKAAIEIEKSDNEAQQAEQSQIANTLTNDDIISLTEKKLPTNLIIQKIKTSTCNFNTSTDELIKLTNAGVSEDVIILMMEKK
jgi:tetratricopeptide (TPR) repeat protein